MLLVNCLGIAGRLDEDFCWLFLLGRGTAALDVDGHRMELANLEFRWKEFY